VLCGFAHGLPTIVDPSTPGKREKSAYGRGLHSQVSS